MENTIKLFVTGGTFDKEYNELSGDLYFRETHIQEVLKMGRCLLDVNVETLMLTDSLHMRESHRNYILDRCMEEDIDKIVITHGTDTMVDTAAMLAQHIKDKTIVLTGAMIPYGFGSSDGLFNLGSALSFAQTLEAGVYISMNGRYFYWNNVRKNRKQGIFETLD